MCQGTGHTSHPEPPNTTCGSRDLMFWRSDSRRAAKPGHVQRPWSKGQEYDLGHRSAPAENTSFGRSGKTQTVPEAPNRELQVPYNLHLQRTRGPEHGKCPHVLVASADSTSVGLRRNVTAAERKFMSVSAISQANGADLLSLLNQSTGQAPAGSAVTASIDVLKKALAQAQSSESQIIAGNSLDSGGQLNVFA
jgi:hypothetical protein